MVLSAKGNEAMDIAIKDDLVVFNTTLAGKWLDVVLNRDVSHMLPKLL
ncbi:putative Glycosyl-transferase family 4_5 [Helianthus anomalus]